MSRQILVSVDSVAGEVNIAVVANGLRQNFELRWCHTPDGLYGFKSNFHPNVIRLTEVAATIFITSFLDILRQVLKIEDDAITIINHRGERLQEIGFLPPTIEVGAEGISDLVARQEILQRYHKVFEMNGRMLTSQFIDACASEGILDDFLCILESKLIGIRFNLDCLAVNTEE